MGRPNAGYAAAAVVAQSVTLGADEGFDALAGRHGNMVDMGIVDPLRVVRSTLANGASVASPDSFTAQSLGLGPSVG